MTEIIPFFLVLLAGLVFSEIFARLHLPFVVALIVAGILIGPFGLEWFTPDDTFEFLGQIGLIFLMFMAGLEIRFSTFRKLGKGVPVLSLLNGLVPFAVGIGIALYFGYNWTAALLLGIIFISSSIAVIIPSLQANNLFQSRLGKNHSFGHHYRGRGKPGHTLRVTSEYQPGCKSSLTPFLRHPRHLPRCSEMGDS